MPDALTLDLSSIVGGSAGMPSDTLLGACAGNNIYLHWRQSSAVINLLSSLKFRYASGPSGACCYLYEVCGADAPCGSGSYLELAGTPFETSTIGGLAGCINFTENTASEPDPVPSGAPCCGDYYWTLTCEEALGHQCTVDDGTFRVPRGSYVSGTLQICISGTTVTLTATLSLVFTFDEYEGTDCNYLGPQLDCDGGGVVSTTPASVECSTGGTPVCVTTSGSVTIEKTIDISGVSGADTWEKIKNADLTGAAFESQAVGVGGGCIDELYNPDWSCETSIDCDGTVIALGTYTGDINVPVDQDGVWSVGTLDLALADATPEAGCGA